GLGRQSSRGSTRVPGTSSAMRITNSTELPSRESISSQEIRTDSDPSPPGSPGARTPLHQLAGIARNPNRESYIDTDARSQAQRRHLTSRIGMAFLQSSLTMERVVENSLLRF